MSSLGNGPFAVAGIDGGGTKTQCLVYDMRSGRTGCGLAGPINLNYVPRSEAKAAVRRALLMAAGSADVDPAALRVIAAAAPWTEQLVCELADETAPAAKVHTPGEDQAALMAGLLRPWGLVLSAGTGSRCAWVPPSGPHVVAGAWGSLFGDEGSGYDIGRRMLQAVTMFWDGRGPQTALAEMVEEHWQLAEPKALVHRVYGPPAGAWRSRIASLCPLVGAAAGSDAVAQDILRGAARDQAQMITAVAGRAGLTGRAAPVEVLVSGGVFGLGPLILQPLRDCLSGEGPYEIVEAQLPPVYGAMLLAMAEAGAAPDGLAQAVAAGRARKSCIMGDDSPAGGG
jgi:N-acetylglucosamine kinase-like BadF-type ATPase